MSLNYRKLSFEKKLAHLYMFDQGCVIILMAGQIPISIIYCWPHLDILPIIDIASDKNKTGIISKTVNQYYSKKNRLIYKQKHVTV